MSNHQKLKELLMDVFLIEESEYSLSMSQVEVDTWDSLGLVSMAVGVEETFGYHFNQAEALSIKTVQDIVDILTSKGIPFHE